ncbi:MAG TPA: DUF1810 domain-containing protein [Stellaceae bacterium]|nr:DUF1810 domain-containing protein [Stellaceae bacterium]
MSIADPYDLERFVAAQEPVFPTALAELRAGRKRTHWMWFIFPQLRGLGRSATATHYGIGSLDEARAYLAHPLLAPRLELCTNAVLGVEGRTPHEIFGSPDDMKFHSSMSLFALAATDTAGPYRKALDRWWHGAADPETLRLLGLRDL